VTSLHPIYSLYLLGSLRFKYLDALVFCLLLSVICNCELGYFLALQVQIPNHRVEYLYNTYTCLAKNSHESSSDTVQLIEACKSKLKITDCLAMSDQKCA